MKIGKETSKDIKTKNLEKLTLQLSAYSSQVGSQFQKRNPETRKEKKVNYFTLKYFYNLFLALWKFYLFLRKLYRFSFFPGLDPHKFTYMHVEPDGRLDETDAEFVQIIHTSGRAISIESPMGHADFYPNGGSSPQPLCAPINQKCKITTLFKVLKDFYKIFFFQSNFSCTLIFYSSALTWCQSSTTYNPFINRNLW